MVGQVNRPQREARLLTDWKVVVRMALEEKYSRNGKDYWLLDRPAIKEHLDRVLALPPAALYTYAQVLAMTEGEPNAHCWIEKWGQHLEENGHLREGFTRGLRGNRTGLY